MRCSNRPANPDLSSAMIHPCSTINCSMTRPSVSDARQTAVYFRFGTPCASKNFRHSSGSVLEAMSCGAVVLGSNTAPVREIIADGQNGILVDFFDVEAIAAKAAQVLQDPASYRSMGRLAEQTVIENYSLEVVLPQLVNLYRESASSLDRVSIE